MKTIKVKLQSPYKKGTAEININDEPIQNSKGLFMALCEAEATILNSMELIFSNRNKGRDIELQKVIEGQFDVLRNQILDYTGTDKGELIKEG